MKLTGTTYYVWRRSDGYIGATAYDPSKWQWPNDAFEVLLVTQDWPTARQRIVDERRQQAGS